MKHFFLAFGLALIPATALAQGSPPPPPPPMFDGAAPTAAQRAAMEQFHTQLESYRQQTRTRIIAALTPAHRSAVATLIGQLALTANPDIRAAAAQLDALFLPAEKSSVVGTAAAERSAIHALMEQQRAAMESALTPDQKAALAQRQSNMQAFEQSHPHPAFTADAGTIVLRTLASAGRPEHMGHWQ